MSKFFLPALLAGLLSACSAVLPRFYTFENLPEEITLTAAAGKTAEFTLEENCTTGYAWRADQTDGVSTQIEHLAGRTDLCGAPGSAKVSMTAVKPGVYLVNLRYLRSWEPQSPAEVIRVRLTVK